MKLRILISWSGDITPRDKVMSKKWIYLERNSTDRVWALTEGKRS